MNGVYTYRLVNSSHDRLIFMLVAVHLLSRSRISCGPSHGSLNVHPSPPRPSTPHTTSWTQYIFAVLYYSHPPTSQILRSRSVIDIRCGGNIPPNGSLWRLLIENATLERQMAQTPFYQHYKIKPTPEKTLMPTCRAVYVAQRYDLE